jgi:glycosyltransferase involved in cell wall biosynthesis
MESSSGEKHKASSMIDDNPLVSVVVPAFNAANTIAETLHSISRQTYPALEIVVVDDGSTDATAEIARRHGDPRLRVVAKANGGVASARNAGIRDSKGAFVAFIDADDLWHPTKIAKQLQVLLAGGPDMALVYAPFRLIDGDGRVLASPHKYGVNGWVIHRHFYSNLVGNGSALLVRRSVLEEFGGFDTCLMEQSAEGCEDLLLQLRIAARYRFGEVSEYLVGYRRLPDNMSSNTDQMIRSGMLAVNKALSECRHIPGLSADTMLRRYEWQRLRTRIRDGYWRDSLRSFVRQTTASPDFVASALWSEVTTLAGKANRFVDRTLRGGRPVPHFYDLDPMDGIDLHHDTATSRALRRLAKLDLAYCPRSAGPQARAASDEPLEMIEPRDLSCSCTYQRG